jgi:membrane protein YdbS with pleckstrin-like domain
MTYEVPVGLPDPTPYLLPGEDLRFVVRRHHPIVLLPSALLTLLVVVVVIVVLVMATPTPTMLLAGALICGGVLLWFGYRYLHWSRTVLVVTNRRLFQLVSLGVMRVTVLPVARQAIVFRQSPIGRAVGFGRVQVRTATGSTLHDFNWLADAADFRDAVTDVAA